MILVKKYLPLIYENINEIKLHPSMYATQWYIL